MGNIFTLMGVIAINAAAAHKALDSTSQKAKDTSGKMDKAFQKIGEAAKKCGQVMVKGLAVGTAAFAALMKTAIGDYAEYEQLVGGVKKLFGDSANEVMKFANEAYKTAGMSANDYMQTVTSFSASLIAGLSGDTEKAAELSNMAITDMADNANTFGTAMSSVQDAYQGFAKQNYTMLDNLKLGYGGTAAEMARLVNDSGVLGSAITVTADTINQVSFDKIIEAIHVIQTEMKITNATAEEAEKTISGSFSMFKASWTNLLTGLASEDSDMDTLVDNFIGSADTLAGNLTKLLPRLRQTIGRVATRVMDEARQRISAGWNNTVWPFIRDQMRIRFGIDLPEDPAAIIGQISAWWNSQTVYESLRDIFSWTLGAFTEPETGIFDSIQTWWTNTAQPGLTSFFQWTFGELVLPAWLDLADNVTAWWENDFSPWLTDTTEWVAGLRFPSWSEIRGTVTSWWQDIRQSLESLCTFYSSVDFNVNRTYTQEELDAAGDWTIDTVGGATVPVRVDGSHANGLDYVPFDGYRSILHRGEAVLTANEANLWRNGMPQQNNINGREIASMVASAVRDAVAGIQFNVSLDSGILVGQLAPGIDRQLGSIASRKGRG